MNDSKTWTQKVRVVTKVTLQSWIALWVSGLKVVLLLFSKNKNFGASIKSRWSLVNDDHLGAVSGRASKRRRSCYGLPCATDLLVAVNNPFLSQIHHKTTTQLLAAAHDYTSQSLVTFWDRTKVLTNKSLGKTLIFERGEFWQKSAVKGANFGAFSMIFNTLDT